MARDDFAQRAALILLLVLAGLVNRSFAAPQEDQATGEPLKQLSLAELGNVEVTTTLQGARRNLEDPGRNLRSYSG